MGGACGAALAVVAFVLTFLADYLATYFLSGRPEFYFEEEGFVFEVIVYPIVFVCFYAPVAAIGGAVIGVVVWWLDRRLPGAEVREALRVGGVGRGRGGEE